jgi:hypothetical protein
MKTETKQFEVQLFYSGFCVHKISAKDESDAILRAREIPISMNEFLSTLENWKDADTVIEICDEKSKI